MRLFGGAHGPIFEGECMAIALFFLGALLQKYWMEGKCQITEVMHSSLFSAIHPWP